MYELETQPVVDSGFDRERTIDDFIFLTFLVGNDFLPHLPALDVGDDAFDLIFPIYKKARKHWVKHPRKGQNPYLTDRGNIVDGDRLEKFLIALGSHESSYYNEKKQNESVERENKRKLDEKYGFESTFPSEEVLSSKEAADRAKYREMMQSVTAEINPSLSFQPVLSDITLPVAAAFQPEEEVMDEGIVEHMGSLLLSSISHSESNKSAASLAMSNVDDQDLKGRYYYDKFQFSPFDADKHTALRKAYVEGLVWNLKYYFQGCVSWSWYYPYHYGPMLSDLRGIDGFLQEINFDPGQPLKPFEQLMGCLPPSSSVPLPEPYRWLMKDPNSPVLRFSIQSPLTRLT
jgi:5'-3' exonuclease